MHKSYFEEMVDEVKSLIVEPFGRQLVCILFEYKDMKANKFEIVYLESANPERKKELKEIVKKAEEEMNKFYSEPIKIGLRSLKVNPQEKQVVYSR